MSVKIQARRPFRAASPPLPQPRGSCTRTPCRPEEPSPVPHSCTGPPGPPADSRGEGAPQQAPNVVKPRPAGNLLTQSLQTERKVEPSPEHRLGDGLPRAGAGLALTRPTGQSTRAPGSPEAKQPSSPQHGPAPPEGPATPGPTDSAQSSRHSSHLDFGSDCGSFQPLSSPLCRLGGQRLQRLVTEPWEAGGLGAPQAGTRRCHPASASPADTEGAEQQATWARRPLLWGRSHRGLPGRPLPPAPACGFHSQGLVLNERSDPPQTHTQKFAAHDAAGLGTRRRTSTLARQAAMNVRLPNTELPRGRLR